MARIITSRLGIQGSIFCPFGGRRSGKPRGPGFGRTVKTNPVRALPLLGSKAAKASQVFCTPGLATWLVPRFTPGGELFAPPSNRSDLSHKIIGAPAEIKRSGARSATARGHARPLDGARALTVGSMTTLIARAWTLRRKKTFRQKNAFPKVANYQKRPDGLHPANAQLDYIINPN